MSKLLIVSFMVLAALGADAQSRMSKGSAKGKDAKVLISRKAQLGSVCIQNAPSANGSTNMKVSRRARQWIVPELEYQTAADWMDQLTVTWHILLDSKSAKLRDKPSKDKPPVPRYSYYSVAVRYVNIPKGPHGASVVLPPSVLERYGEPAIITAVLTNSEGDILDFQNEGASQLFGKAVSKDPKWWENNDIISATDQKTGEPLVARRQGLVDRSKTVFALVNADDYEMVHQ